MTAERDQTGRGPQPSARHPNAIAHPPSERADGSPWRTLARRTYTFSLYFFFFVLVNVTLPVLLPVAAIADLALKRPWPLVRVLTFMTVYLWCEIGGILACFALYLGSFLPGVDHERYLAWNFRLQRLWARGLGIGFPIFGIRFMIEGGDLLREAPFLAFVRHASTADAVLPPLLISCQHGVRIRFVGKHELRWDPCLDLIGHRLKNYFVRRGSNDSAREVEAVGRLAEGLAADECVVIWPEGTRFSTKKRARILEKLEASGDVRLVQRARELESVLPPRLGGPLRLLERAGAVDAVFIAHRGLEGSASFWSLARGGLVRRTVHVRIWRVPHAEIPTDREARSAWLYDQWEQVDAFVRAGDPQKAAVPAHA